MKKKKKDKSSGKMMQLNLTSHLYLALHKYGHMDDGCAVFNQVKAAKTKTKESLSG